MGGQGGLLPTGSCGGGARTDVRAGGGVLRTSPGWRGMVSCGRGGLLPTGPRGGGARTPVLGGGVLRTILGCRGMHMVP